MDISDLTKGDVFRYEGKQYTVDDTQQSFRSLDAVDEAGNEKHFDEGHEDDMVRVLTQDADLDDLVQQARNAAYGDSNDGEISALQSALDAAIERVQKLEKERLVLAEEWVGDAYKALTVYTEAQNEYDAETGSVKDYENFEDSKLAFADTAEALLMRALGIKEVPDGNTR